MKISFIILGFFKSGGMRVIYEISNGLVNKGHDVTLYKPVIPFNFFQGELSLKSLRHYIWNIKSVVCNKQNSEYSFALFRNYELIKRSSYIGFYGVSTRQFNYKY